MLGCWLRNHCHWLRLGSANTVCTASSAVLAGYADKAPYSATKCTVARHVTMHEQPGIVHKPIHRLCATCQGILSQMTCVRTRQAAWQTSKRLLTSGMGQTGIPTIGMHGSRTCRFAPQVTCACNLAISKTIEPNTCGEITCCAAALGCKLSACVAYLVCNWRIIVYDIVLRAHNKQSAMLPSLLICHIPLYRCTAGTLSLVRSVRALHSLHVLQQVYQVPVC